MDLFGGTISNLQNGLNYASLKNKTIAQNIANVDTPNYKAKNVSFKKMLSEAQNNSTITANRTDTRHYDFSIKQSTPGVYSLDNYNYRSNGNGVDMDEQQSNLAENQIYYNALIERVSGKLNTLNSVIRGGV